VRIDGDTAHSKGDWVTKRENKNKAESDRIVIEANPTPESERRINRRPHATEARKFSISAGRENRWCPFFKIKEDSYGVLLAKWQFQCEAGKR